MLATFAWNEALGVQSPVLQQSVSISRYWNSKRRTIFKISLAACVLRGHISKSARIRTHPGMSTLQMHEQYSRVPPGFRFHPTDEELVGYYLQKKVACKRIDLDVIRELDLYRMEPWDLQERCKIGTGEQHDWYFFSHKDKKYPTGTRTNRATGAGFWKATGRDKAIFTKYKVIGMRKTLVFYRGRAPNGQKTNWIMHEYRLEEDHSSNTTSSNEEGWVVCRVFKKRQLIHRRIGQNDAARCYEEQIDLLPEMDDSLDDQNLLSESNPSFYTHSFVCKEELDLEDNEAGPYSTAQLPQPGSPESQCDGPRNVGQLIAAINQPLPLLFEVPELADGQCPKRHVRSELCCCTQEDATIITQWSVVDRLVAEQLGQDEPSKGLSLRFPTGSCNEFQLLSDRQQADLSYAEDVDLWSFVK